MILLEVDFLLNVWRFYFYKQLLLLDMVHCLCVSNCGKTFASRRKLLDHEQRCNTCNRVAKYRCGTCGKLFSTVVCLKRHEVVHSDVRNFTCRICDRRFKRKGDCKKHGLTHSDVRNYRCHICDQAFKRKEDCIRHEEEHSGIRNYKCIKCDKGFLRYGNARHHEKICRKTSTSMNPAVHRNTLNLSCQVSVGDQTINIGCWNTLQ